MRDPSCINIMAKAATNLPIEKGNENLIENVFVLPCFLHWLNDVLI